MYGSNHSHHQYCVEASGHLNTTAALLPVKKSATQRTVGIVALRLLEKRKCFAPAGIRTLYRPIRSLLIVATVGCRLCCKKRKMKLPFNCRK